MCFRYLVALLTLIPSFVLAQPTDSTYVILISFDGFRYDYVEKYNAPNFKSFITGGTAAKGLIPCNPSKTFPNHYTIITGLYPGHHGLVDNTFLDKKLGLKYEISNRDAVENPAFYNGLPLWQLAQQNGLKTASYFWVGSETPIQGKLPTYYYRYDETVSNEARVDQAIQWLNLPKSDRPQLITLYFSLIDDAGHDFGPNAPELRLAVLQADSILGRLLNGLDTLSMEVDVVITSDHGMRSMETAIETYIILEDLPGYSDTSITWVSNGTHVHVYGDNAQKLKRLKRQLRKTKSYFKVWNGSKTPKKWHYRHYRIGDLFLQANPGNYFLSKAAFQKKQLDGMVPKYWGTHGFDPTFCPEMQGIFYANGPHIRAGIMLPAFENIHIYPLIASLLGLSYPPIDGNPDVLNGIILRN
jgi:alkaline phosphatase D